MVDSGRGRGFGWISQRRAHIAEIESRKSRSEAEKLVNFLIEDFYAELEPTGRLETLGKLAHMTVGYYDGLPPQLVTPRTRSVSRDGAGARRRRAAIERQARGGYKAFAEADKRVFVNCAPPATQRSQSYMDLRSHCFTQGTA